MAETRIWSHLWRGVVDTACGLYILIDILWGLPGRYEDTKDWGEVLRGFTPPQIVVSLLCIVALVGVNWNWIRMIRRRSGSDQQVDSQIPPRRQLASTATLSSTQKRMICKLADVSDGKMLYQDLLTGLGLEGSRQVNTERAQLELSGLVEYKDREVWLTEPGWQVGTELENSGQCKDLTSEPKSPPRFELIPVDDAIAYVQSWLRETKNIGSCSMDDAARLLTEAAKRGNITVYCRLRNRDEEIGQSEFRDFGYKIYRHIQQQIGSMKLRETVVGMGQQAVPICHRPFILRESLLQAFPRRPTSET